MASGVLAEKTGKLEEIAKVFISLAVLVAIGICELMRLSGMEAGLIALCAL